MLFEVPASVVTVTETDEEPLGGGGTVALHDMVDEQLVGATSLPKRAKTCPLALLKLAPVITTIWPGVPVDGDSELSTGGPPGTTAGTVVVVDADEPDGLGGIEAVWLGGPMEPRAWSISTDARMRPAMTRRPATTQAATIKWRSRGGRDSDGVMRFVYPGHRGSAPTNGKWVRLGGPLLGVLTPTVTRADVVKAAWLTNCYTGR